MQCCCKQYNIEQKSPFAFRLTGFFVINSINPVTQQTQITQFDRKGNGLSCFWTKTENSAIFSSNLKYIEKKLRQKNERSNI